MLRGEVTVYFLLCYGCSKAIVQSWWMPRACRLGALGGNLELGLQSRASAAAYPRLIQCWSVRVRTAVSGPRQTWLEHVAFNWAKAPAMAFSQVLGKLLFRSWRTLLRRLHWMFFYLFFLVLFCLFLFFFQGTERQAADGTWQAHLEMLFSIKSAWDSKVSRQSATG